ncbi:MAG: pseudouridine synthase [Oliverpabstia sp.]
MSTLLRLDKFLADVGIGTRTQVKQMIRKGQIQVNGTVIKKPEYKIDAQKDRVAASGEELSYQKYRYFMLHKPAGCVCATEDRKEKTVLSLVPEEYRKDLFPVGRLDKDTEGLLLLTNDGDLAHRLLAPKKHVDKVYYAKIEGQVTEQDVEAFREGIDIGDDKLTMPAVLEILHSSDISEIQVTIQEGRFHQIKRMFEAVGKKVLYLKRLTMGPLHLDPLLGSGEIRPLTEDEIRTLCERK